MADILVVDDNPAICNVLQQTLEMDGHAVTCTDEADRLSDLLQSQPDVILLDVWMPQMTGLECIPLIRRTAPESKIIIITGISDHHVTDLLYEQGIDGLLPKPISIHSLRKTITSVLGSV